MWTPNFSQASLPVLTREMRAEVEKCWHHIVHLNTCFIALWIMCKWQVDYFLSCFTNIESWGYFELSAVVLIMMGNSLLESLSLGRLAECWLFHKLQKLLSKNPNHTAVGDIQSGHHNDHIYICSKKINMVINKGINTLDYRSYSKFSCVSRTSGHQWKLVKGKLFSQLQLQVHGVPYQDSKWTQRPLEYSWPGLTQC